LKSLVGLLGPQTVQIAGIIPPFGVAGRALGQDLFCL
jgi:hypothetical protein